MEARGRIAEPSGQCVQPAHVGASSDEFRSDRKCRTKYATATATVIQAVMSCHAMDIGVLLLNEAHSFRAGKTRMRPERASAISLPLCLAVSAPALST